MKLMITPEQANAIIDAWDEGTIMLSTGFQEHIGQNIVDSLQEQLFATDESDDAIIELSYMDGDWDTQLTLLQMMEQS